MEGELESYKKKLARKKESNSNGTVKANGKSSLIDVDDQEDTEMSEQVAKNFKESKNLGSTKSLIRRGLIDFGEEEGNEEEEEYKVISVKETKKRKVSKDKEKEVLKERKKESKKDEKARSSGGKSFKHVEVIRNKEERMKIPGKKCTECEKFYKATGSEHLIESCSRHRNHNHEPDTPPGFWDTNFPGFVNDKENPSSVEK